MGTWRFIAQLLGLICTQAVTCASTWALLWLTLGSSSAEAQRHISVSAGMLLIAKHRGLECPVLPRSAAVGADASISQSMARTSVLLSLRRPVEERQRAGLAAGPDARREGGRGRRRPCPGGARAPGEGAGQGILKEGEFSVFLPAVFLVKARGATPAEHTLWSPFASLQPLNETWSAGVCQCLILAFSSILLIYLRTTVQVYVTVYSDGPTRVLRFSDEPNITSTQAEQSILDLAARLKQARTLTR